MTTYATRPYASGWIAGIARIRDRDGEPDIDIRRAKRAVTPETALRAAIDAHPPERSQNATTEPEQGRARPSSPDPDRLKPQARQVLHHLILRRGLTPRQAMAMTPPCYRLAARIAEIRAEFGREAVETQTVPHEGGSHAKYVWRGPDALQAELEAR